MEKELKTLFDYQRFEKNERLEKMIRRAETAYPEELTELELELVAGGTGAAGMRNRTASVTGEKKSPKK